MHPYKQLSRVTFEFGQGLLEERGWENEKDKIHLHMLARGGS